MKNKARTRLNITVQKISEGALRDLARFESDGLALSFYISSRIGNEPWGKVKSEISSIQAEGRKLINDAAIDKRLKAGLKQKLDDVVKYLDVFEIPDRAKALAVFVGAGEARIITLPFIATRDVKLKRIFHIKHLVEALSRKSLYAILSASRTEGEILVVDRGEIVEASEPIRGEVPRKTKSGEEERSGFGTGGARSHDLRSKKIGRHIEWHLEKHFEKIARLLFDHFWRKYKFKYLLVESLEDHKPKIEKALHPYLKPEFKIFWRAVPNESLGQVSEKGEEYFEKIQQEEDRKIVKNIIEGVGRPKEFVSGVDETLDQLNKNTLDTIFVSENLQTTGYYSKADADVAVSAKKDFFAGEEEIYTLDLLDAICRKAVLTNTKIRFVENAEEFDRIGGIAGRLKNY